VNLRWILSLRDLSGFNQLRFMKGTEQEEFWAGSFGYEYTKRNQGEQLSISKYKLFQKILIATKNVNSVLEIGCNIGLNLRAIQAINADINLYGVEINKEAASIASTIQNSQIFNQSILDIRLKGTYDLCFTAGLLIHIAPDSLRTVYDILYQRSSRYILVYEYYHPTPVEVSYRGHQNKLFKRDFAGELLDLYPSLELVSYEFIYHRDPCFPDDDLTWFLMKKSD
jgi:pseudaminic acid biosynthesis-associated methylase